MFLEGRNHLSRSVEVGSSIALRRDSREVTVTTKCEFILCISRCSRFLPKRSLHLEQIDIKRSSNMNKILMDNYKGQAGNKQGAVRESNGFILRVFSYPLFHPHHNSLMEAGQVLSLFYRSGDSGTALGSFPSSVPCLLQCWAIEDAL